MRLSIGLLAAAILAAATHGQKVCNLALQVCPKTLADAAAGGTLDVPTDAIWLDPKLPFCTEQVQVQTSTSALPPSIVFIIDNSGSMNTRDGQEYRFSHTIRLLDSIATIEPATKVGIVVFSRRLSFDERENSLFDRAFPGDSTQFDSYIPLTALNADVGGRTGLDTLKALLAHDRSGDLRHATRLPATRVSSNGWSTTSTRDGTDISLGFQAAKQALVGDKNPKTNQFFIFLSDGEPSGLDIGRENLEWEWVKGDNVPTTFTVFFSPISTAPDSITKMNANIRANGYSATNPKSNLWAINLAGAQLIDLLLDNVLNPIFANTPATPVSATLTSGTVTAQNVSKDGTGFIFPERIPLGPNQTSVKLNYTYTYRDSGKNLTRSFEYDLAIRRVPGSSLPAGATTVCKDVGDIELQHEGKKISIVTADHAKLDVKLMLPDGESCADCKVEVKPVPKPNRPALDIENVSLAGSGTTYAGSFQRETISTTPIADGRLTHLPGDSIVITWVNPANPLHVMRRAFPYNDISTVLQVKNPKGFITSDYTAPRPAGKHWIIAGSPDMVVSSATPNCCEVKPVLTEEDTTANVGIRITASRGFRVQIQVYDNLGQFVNRLSFVLTQEQFNALPKPAAGSNRTVWVLWDTRTENGSYAGTGAYIFKTAITLNKIPGVAEDAQEITDHRRVGVIRGSKPAGPSRGRGP